MRGDTLQRGIQSADHRQHDRISQPERLEDETGKPLNPVVAWSGMFIGYRVCVGVGPAPVVTLSASFQ